MSGRISSWRAPGSGGVPIPWVSKRHGDKWWDSVDGLGGPEGFLQEGFMVCKANCCSISPSSITPSCAEDHHQLFPDLVLSHLTMDGEKQRQDSTFPRVDMSPVSTSIHQYGELPHCGLLHPLSSTPMATQHTHDPLFGSTGAAHNPKYLAEKKGDLPVLMLNPSRSRREAQHRSELSDPSNYRPLGPTSITAKIMEKLIRASINKELNGRT